MVRKGAIQQASYLLQTGLSAMKNVTAAARDGWPSCRTNLLQPARAKFPDSMASSPCAEAGSFFKSMIYCRCDRPAALESHRTYQQATVCLFAVQPILSGAPHAQIIMNAAPVVPSSQFDQRAVFLRHGKDRKRCQASNPSYPQPLLKMPICRWRSIR